MVLHLGARLGFVRLGRGLWRHSLTVLNYHRIDKVTGVDFPTFKPNVSASPEAFERQMAYLARWYNVVSLQDVLRWLDGKAALPPYAALITFDDGYRDNYLHAYPILQRYQFPAVIFLTSDFIESDLPFYWDLVAYVLAHTTQDFLEAPDGITYHWHDRLSRERAASQVVEALKSLPEVEKRAWVEALPARLKVSPPAGFFRELMLTWEQVRQMHRDGMEFGGHTMRHPILTRVPVSVAREEIVGAKVRLEQELGEPVFGFAYPNGGKGDFNSEIQGLVAEAGFRTAFTLFPGPSSLSEVRRQPFAVRRIFISHKHSFADFTVLLHWFNRYRH